MTCADFLQPFVEWAKGASIIEDRHLALHLTSNDKEGPVRYAEGQLRLKTSTFHGLELASFEGEASLYESNERWGYPPPPGQFGDQPYPFAPANDKVQVRIEVATGRITVTSTTKGKAVISDPQCADAVLFGFASAGHGPLGVAGFRYFSPTQQAAIAESDLQNAGGSDFGTGPLQPRPPLPFHFLRPYYVLSFRQEKWDIAQ